LRALNVMHHSVLPHLTRAVLVMDWVAGGVEEGGTHGLLALNALWVLMKEYNLDYPSFYPRLYAFLDRGVLHSKWRARFFRLLEIFLGSTHLPLTLLASFIKRLARLSLSAPPAAIVIVIPFTYNLLKHHPGLMVMIHRPEDPDSDPDSYSPMEISPFNTQALSSSLWELQTHTRHWHTGVATLAKVFSEAFTKQGYKMEDFLDLGYAGLFDADAKRSIKKEPALAIDSPVDLFASDPSTSRAGDEVDADVDVGRVGELDVIRELWSFA